MRYRVRNWRRFQHYKDRDPPWIKLNFSILSSPDWVALADANRVLAIACMLIASRNGGEIDGSEVGLEYLKRVAYLDSVPDLSPLIRCGFLESVNGSLADASTAQADASVVSPPSSLSPPSTPSIPTTTPVEAEAETERTLLSGKPDDSSPQVKIPKTGTTDELEILDYLNRQTGRAYRPVRANLDPIKARLKDGVTVLQIKEVIFDRVKTWSTDERMRPYLRPKTLFNRTNFEQYLGELRGDVSAV